MPSRTPYMLVQPSGPSVPVIAHVPHASTYIPEAAAREFVADSAVLAREVIRLTDWHADQLFSWVLDLGGMLLVNTLSRLVFDPERFSDDAVEPMAAVGQGVVYTRTTEGEPLADITPASRAARISEFYEPYHAGFDAAVGDLLDRFGMAVILDCHSFATEPLPSEPDQSPGRPDICIGTDTQHTPGALVEGLENGFRSERLTVERDRPFSGTIVPLRYVGDARISSVMIEVRRGLYCNESTGQRNDRFDSMRSVLERVIAPVVLETIGAHPTT